MGVYVKQYNNGRHSCGPISILNALKFQGRKFTRRHLPKIVSLLRSTKTGVGAQDIDRVLRRMKLGRRMRRPTWKKILQALKDGNGILICANFYREKRRYGHIMFVAGVQVHGYETSLYLTNDPVGNHHWCHRFWIDDYYRRTSDYHWLYPIWIIPPKRIK